LAGLNIFVNGILVGYSAASEFHLITKSPLSISTLLTIASFTNADASRVAIGVELATGALLVLSQSFIL
jgi:hypothetical protein